MQPAAPGYGGSSPAPSTSLWICRHCGVVAPLQASTCEVCKEPLANVRVASPPERIDHTWVAVRCGFTCNSCRFLAPLDALDADGAVECAHCGLRQRFEVDRWRDALEFAHGVGDLSGPSPEGRNPHPVLWIGSENAHASTGVTRTFEQATFGTLAIDAAPGHPVCGRCRDPLVVSARPGAVDARCPRCGDQATHSISSAAVDLYPALIAAVSEEHRSDRPKARAAATSAGVVALSCPACGAPLELTEAGTVQTCRYCRASCIVPHQSVARALARTPEPAIWWLYFGGSSAERERLVAPPDGGADKASSPAALRLLQLARKKMRLGDEPGVYETPERPGFNWLQLAVTVSLGAVALLIGMVLASVAVGYDLDLGSLGH